MTASRRSTVRVVLCAMMVTGCGYAARLDFESATLEVWLRSR